MIRPWAIGWLGFHFLLTLAVSCRDTFDIFGRSETIFPTKWAPAWRNAGDVAAAVATTSPRVPLLLRETVQAYEHAAGIEAGYGFFAPNIPGNYKIVFELHHADGRVDYDIPAVASKAAGLRLAGVLDFIAETDYEDLRALMLKFLTESAWREHPDVTSIHTLLGLAVIPSPEEYRHGKRETYKALSEYTFAFRGKLAPDSQN